MQEKGLKVVVLYRVEEGIFCYGDVGGELELFVLSFDVVRLFLGGGVGGGFGGPGGLEEGVDAVVAGEQEGEVEGEGAGGL